jgi:RNA polymerase-binding transcription factor DksA
MTTEAVSTTTQHVNTLQQGCHWLRGWFQDRATGRTGWSPEDEAVSFILGVQLREMEEALSRGPASHCEKCGSPIEAPRLKVLPETRVCSNCAKRLGSRTQGNGFG